MSKINKTSSEIKKKLSLNDYNKPLTKEKASAVPTSKPKAIKKASSPKLKKHQPTGKKAAQKTRKPAVVHAKLTTHKHTSKQIKQHAGKIAAQRTNAPAQQPVVSHKEQERLPARHYIGKSTRHKNIEPSIQDASVPTSFLTEFVAPQPTSIPARHHAQPPVHPETVPTAYQQTVATAQFRTEPPSLPQADTPTNQHDGKAKELKTKATYYLGHQELSMLTHLFINQLRKYNKADKSALVCEAIRLLFDRDGKE